MVQRSETLAQQQKEEGSTWEKARGTFTGCVPSCPLLARKYSTYQSKQNSEYFDPCQESASRSIKCLHRNGGDKDLCADYFQ